MTFWASLPSASIEGIEFDARSRHVGGGHEFGRKRYQGRGGQETEPTGREPLSISLVIELFRSVRGDHYPLIYGQLANVLTDDALGGQVTYVDPLLGELPMQIVTFGLDENAERQDGGVITLTMEERNTEPLDLTVPVVVTRPGPQAIATGRELDVALPSAYVFDETTVRAFSASGYPLSGAEVDYPPGAVFANLAADSVNRLISSACTVDFARGEVDRFRSRIDAMLAAPELLAVEAFEARASLALLFDSISQCALDAVARSGIESSVTPNAGGTTAQALARQVYGDPTRWTDIAAANGQTRNPLRLGSTTTGPLRVFLPRRRVGAGRFG